MSFFALFPIAKLEYNKEEASIIDLVEFSRINYSGNKKDSLLHILNQNIEEYTVEEKEIIKELMENGLAYIYSSNIKNSEHRENRDAEVRGITEEIPHFSQIYFEVSKSCDVNCGFCEKVSEMEGSCGSCIKWKHSTGCIENFECDKVIERISHLWVDEIVLSGGNPFQNKEVLLEYIRKIREYMPNVAATIVTNSVCIHDDELKLCYDYQCSIQAVVTLEGKEEAEIRNQIDEIVKNCTKNQMKLKISVMSRELNQCKKIEEYIEENYGIECSNFCVPFSERNDRCTEVKNKKNSNYFLNQKYNACLNNKMAITQNGYLRPCPMIEDDLADLKCVTLDVVFQNNLLDKYWRFTKNKNESCKECPYKYSCESCMLIDLK